MQGALAAYNESLRLLPDAADALANRDLIEQLLQQQDEQQSDQQQNQGEPQSDQSADSDSDPSSQDASNQNTGENNPSGESSSDQQAQPQTGDHNDAGGGEAPEEQPRSSEGEDQQSSDLNQALDADRQSQMARFDDALEEQQALEQWLRRVPDDPGGLLRRKFRYQTLQRIRNGEEPEDDIRW